MTNKSTDNRTNNPLNEVSEAQLLANLRNAQKSTGPKTETGKARSSMNARRHGLTGQFYVMNDTDRLAYEVFEKSILVSLKPVGAYEHQLAISIAQDHWRINRSRAIEFNTLGLGHEERKGTALASPPEVEAAITQARTWHHEHPALTNTVLYESRVSRMISKNEKRLDEIQQTRKAEEAAALEEAELLFCQSVMTQEAGAATSPVQVNGFVFSAAKLVAGLNRKAAVASARFYQSVDWDFNERLPDHHKLPVFDPDLLKNAA